MSFPIKGIDVSSWQTGMDIATVCLKNGLEFAICKATEGTYLVDGMCDRFISELIRTKRLWGFYHFARNTDPVKEAEFFYRNTKNYFGHGIPVLDIEDSSIPDWSAYAKKWADYIHTVSGVWPMIYTNAGSCWRFSDNDVFKNCALWVAGYPYPYKYWSDAVLKEFDYSIYPWATATAWQFTGTGDIYGYTGNVDLDYAWLDADSWMRIATGGKSEPVPPAKDSLFLTACKVIAGLYGNGDARKEKLAANGYDYDQVQKLVSKMIEDYS